MKSDIFDFVMNLPAVDAHEHLLPEDDRLRADIDVLYLFHQYVPSDLRSAGMPAADAEKIRSGDGTLEERWNIFSPYLRYIRHTGFARPVFIALRDIYGINDLNAGNYRKASENIRSQNTPGITDRCLGQRGKITTILNCNYRFKQPVEYSHGIMPVPTIPSENTSEFLQTAGREQGLEIDSLEALASWADRVLKHYRKNNIIGLKTTSRSWHAVSAAEAAKCLKIARTSDRLDEDTAQIINNHLLDCILSFVPKYNFTVAVHTGIFAGANTFFYRSHVRNLVPLLLKHPDVRFDLFHLSFPWVTESIAIAQKFTNAHLNLTWMPIINPAVTRRAITEIICSVPSNKVLAMGGDYWRLPDVAYGHLQLARQLFAQALSDCIESAWLSVDSAKDIARLWLQENAFSTYPLAAQ